MLKACTAKLQWIHCAGSPNLHPTHGDVATLTVLTSRTATIAARISLDVNCTQMMHLYVTLQPSMAQLYTRNLTTAPITSIHLFPRRVSRIMRLTYA
jgi:hypothetical protein